MSTKSWLLLVGAVIVGFAIYAITRVGSTPAGLTVLGEDSSNLQAYETLSSSFSKNSGVSVAFEGATFETALKRADGDFQSGAGKYDIVLQYNFSLAPYVENRYVAAVRDVYSPTVLGSQRILDDIFPNALKETCYYYSDPHDPDSPPAQFGLPFAANTMLLVYNKSLFEAEQHQSAFKDRHQRALAVPTTWKEYLDVAQYFSAQEGLSGVCVQGAPDGWLYYELCNYLFSMGPGTSEKERGWEKTSKLTIDAEANVQALEFFKSLKECSSGDFYTVDAAKQRELMLEGKTAMAIMWSDYIQPLAWPNSETSPTFGFAPIPGTVSGLAGGAFYINRRSRNMQAAAAFVLFALEPPHQAQLVERGLCSPLKSAYTEEVLRKVPYARALRDSLVRGVFMFEASNDADIISSAITTHAQRFMRGELSARDALRQAQQEVIEKR